MSTKLSPSGRTLVETKVALGNWSASKKSADLMWPSRCGFPVVMVVTSISACTEGVPSSATVMVPLNDSNLPRTLLTIRCFTTKPTVEWVGSMFQTPASMGALTVLVVMVKLLGFLSFRVVVRGPSSRPIAHSKRTAVRFHSTGAKFLFPGEYWLLKAIDAGIATSQDDLDELIDHRCCRCVEQRGVTARRVVVGVAAQPWDAELDDRTRRFGDRDEPWFVE
ncbi:Uncharacterised protein [Mycobacteroides abscessus subsp. abscessus]|nr:Uncharacterised protein [Mycobacteroides abscessus subsp. abscessus]